MAVEVRASSARQSRYILPWWPLNSGSLQCPPTSAIGEGGEVGRVGESERAKAAVTAVLTYQHIQRQPARDLI
jgi:hypothetical protein